jgi:hypothetical protein
MVNTFKLFTSIQEVLPIATNILQIIADDELMRPTTKYGRLLLSKQISRFFQLKEVKHDQSTECGLTYAK